MQRAERWPHSCCLSPLKAPRSESHLGLLPPSQPSCCRCLGPTLLILQPPPSPHPQPIWLHPVFFQMRSTREPPPMPAPYRSQDTPRVHTGAGLQPPSPSSALPLWDSATGTSQAPLPNVLPSQVYLLIKTSYSKLSSDCTSPGGLLWVPRVKLSGRYSVQRVPPGLCRPGYNYDL